MHRRPSASPSGEVAGGAGGRRLAQLRQGRALGDGEGRRHCAPRRSVGAGPHRSHTRRPARQAPPVEPHHLRTCVRALGRSIGRPRGGAKLAGNGGRARPHLRRARGPWDQFPRGPREVGPEQGSRQLPAVQLHGQRFSGLRACLRLLLRPQHSHLPRLRRRPRLRAGNRGQGERPRAGSRRSCGGRPGSESWSPSAPTPIPTSGPRGATS